MWSPTGAAVVTLVCAQLTREGRGVRLTDPDAAHTGTEAILRALTTWVTSTERTDDDG